MSVPRASRSTSNSIGKLPVRRMAIPAYRPRKGYDQAIVTLTDSATGRRRDYWLGTHGTPESRELYHRLLADWETSGRRLPDRPSEAPAPAGKRTGTTVAQLVSQYWKWAKEYYTESSAYGVRVALRVLRECHGSTDAGSFGPNALRVVRDAMVLGKAEGKYRRPPWCRKTINTRVADIVRMFKWAASREILGAEVYQALNTLAPLKRGRCAAPDHEPIRPVPMELVEAVKPHVSRQVRALIELQLLCGARPGELLPLRASDIDTGCHVGHVGHSGGKGGRSGAGGGLGGSGGVWVYRPSQHKNVHRGKDRSIYFGPQAQKILAELMVDRARAGSGTTTTEAADHERPTPRMEDTPARPLPPLLADAADHLHPRSRRGTVACLHVPDTPVRASWSRLLYGT